MRRPPTWPARWAALCCAALLALANSPGADAAPAPFARALPQSEQLRRGNLAGTWTLHWHGSRGSVTLTADGRYSCRWCGLNFTGSWKVYEGQLWITESYRPTDSNSWHAYSVSLEPASGRPAPIRLERVR